MTKPLILAIDDDASALRVLATVLQDTYVIILAKGGKQGLERLRLGLKPELILLDVRMPDMDGYAVLQQLRADATTKDIPVIFVTADSTDMGESSGLDLGADDYITKPVAPPVLMARINGILRRKAAKTALAERSRQLAEALDFNHTILLNSPLPIGVYAADGQCILANEAYARLVGSTCENLLAQNFKHITSWNAVGLVDECLTALTTQCQRQREVQAVTSFGKKLWVDCQIFPIHINNADHLLVQIVDLTERKQLEEELRHIAFHDALTRLPNRRLLLDRLRQALLTGKRQNSYAALLFLDLNKFKQLNDAHGHDVGDLLLIEVAQRLRRIVRERDTVARLGGDEFVVLLEELDADKEKAEEHVAVFSEKIRETLSAEYIFGDIHHHGSASIGIKLFLGEHDPDEILKEADAAMYEAKKSRPR